MKINLSLPILLFFLLALFSNLSLAKKETKVVGDPELKTCKHQCLQQQKYSEDDKLICLRSCDEYHGLKHEREKQIEEQIHEHEGSSEEHEEEEESSEKKEEQVEEGGEEEEEYPYIFEEDRDFDTKFETEDGRIRLLKKFTEKSELLKGIENIRLTIVEAKPHTFVAPRHFDSDVVLFNIKGILF